jgi:hypothetical protein
MNHLKQKNIDNLTSLWKLAGNSIGEYIQHKDFSTCQIQHSQWPNRIWFNVDVNEEILMTVAEAVKNSPVPLSVSDWSDFDNSHLPLFEQFGFSKKSEQIGMSLKLDQAFEQFNRLDLKRVAGSDQASMWAELYPLCFGYKISFETIDRTQTDIQYYLIYRNKEAIGTAIVHETEDLVGIHGVGIIPECRKQGFAEETMAILLNKVIARNKKFATLQASAMGKNIYRKMGFTEDFIMTNYQLK